MATNLQNQFISESFQKLIQIDGNALADGTGSAIASLDITVSSALNATNATSASYATNALSASYAPTILPSGVVSGSSQIILQDTTGNLSGSRIDGAVAEAVNATSASYALTATNAVSASIANTATTAILATSAISASHALVADNALEAENAVHADALQFPVIAKETMSKGDPVYVSGYNAGQDLPDVLKADASNPTKMPAVGLVMEDAVNNDRVFISVAGNFPDVDTVTGLTAPSVGQTLYVASGGGYTNVKPTGTNLIQNVGVIGRVNQNNGEILVSCIQRSNDVPNIAEGNIWVGNVNGVATATSTGSFAKTDKNNTFTGTQTFDNIEVNGTGSFAYIQSVTGSAKIVGDAFIILNNDTPVQRYAGLVVQDSGSLLTTASLEFDGQSNDWFYEYSNDGGVTTDHGVALFGPDYSVKGTPTYPTNNTIQKGNGGHHLLDSIITDDGSTVVVGGDLTANTITANTTFSGNLTGNASTATSSSHALISDTATTALTATSASYSTVAENLTPGNKVHQGYITNNFDAPGGGSQVNLYNISNATGPNGDAYNNFSFNVQDYGGAYTDALIFEKWDSFGYNYGTEMMVNGERAQLSASPKGGGTFSQLFIRDRGDQNSQIYGRADEVSLSARGTYGGALSLTYENLSGSAAASSSFANIGLGQNFNDPTRTQTYINAQDIQIGIYGPNNGAGQIVIGSIDHTVNTSISSQETFIDGKLTIEGSVKGWKNVLGTSGTVNIDFADRNFFSVTPTGAITLTPTNVPGGGEGQTVSVVIDNTASQTVSFTGIQWAGGTAPTITAGGKDIITLISVDGTVYGTSVQNLS